MCRVSGCYRGDIVVMDVFCLGVLKYVCVKDVMDVVFSVGIVRRGAVCALVWEVLFFRHADVVCLCFVLKRSFNKHSGYVAERVSSRNNILKALAGTSWGQQKETLLMTYMAVERSIIHYAAPVWSTNLRDTNYRNIQYIQNEALRISTDCHKMFSVDHLHVEAKMLKVREHSELPSAQYLARCLEPGNVCHAITTREPPRRRMKEILFTRHSKTVEPMMLADNRKATLQAIHTDAVNKAKKIRK